MNYAHARLNISRWLATAGLAGAMVMGSGMVSLRGADAEPSAADKLWKEIEVVSQPPVQPAEWRQKRPPESEIAAFRKKLAEQSVAGADKAGEFYAKFPEDKRSDEARKMERQLLDMSAQFGNTNVLTRLEALETKEMAKLKDDEKFQLRAHMVQRRALTLREVGMEAVLAEFEAGVRKLQKEFPGRTEPEEMLMEIATNAQGDAPLRIAKELAAGAKSDEIKAAAKAIVDRYDRVGKPLDLKFKAVDGTEVDLAKLKGKVVLIDFWATWCGPCMVELPNVKKAYERLHPKGFEIVGISFDQKKEKLEEVVASEKMTWSHYFDGKGWENDFGKKFGIQSIPTMWLVDKKGILRDLNARPDLESKVEKMLAEQ